MGSWMTASAEARFQTCEALMGAAFWKPVAAALMLLALAVVVHSCWGDPKTRGASSVRAVGCQDDHPAVDETGLTRVDGIFSENGTLSVNLATGATPSLVAFRVNGPVQGFRIRDEHHPAVGDLDGWIAHWTAGCKSDREKAEAIFGFVCGDIKDWYYPAKGIDLTIEDLGELIWGFGYGFCYDLGRLFAGLCHRAGLRSRIVGWTQHTVAEVFYDGAWHLYDLQHRTHYEDARGVTVGFHELKRHPELFSQKLDRFGLDAIGYPPEHMVKWYGIAEPVFQDSQDGVYWKTDRDYRIDLREGERFEILFSEPGPTYHPDSWFQYYGSMTLEKDPPWPLSGQWQYTPTRVDAWEAVATPTGEPGFALFVESPFLFTGAYLSVPSYPRFSRVWVQCGHNTVFVGRLVNGLALLSRYVQGAYGFKVIVEAPKSESGPLPEPPQLGAKVCGTLQISPLGLPQVRAGCNRLPVEFDAGSPRVSVWVDEHAQDLRFVSFTARPATPQENEPVWLTYVVENAGSGRSRCSLLHVFNNTTAFFAETVEQVGSVTVPALAPGQSVRLSVPWSANTRMTWYGQDPSVQRFDAWLDMEKDRPEVDRENNRRQDCVQLKRPSRPAVSEIVQDAAAQQP